LQLINIIIIIIIIITFTYCQNASLVWFYQQVRTRSYPYILLKNIRL